MKIGFVSDKPQDAEVVNTPHSIYCQCAECKAIIDALLKMVGAKCPTCGR